MGVAAVMPSSGAALVMLLSGLVAGIVMSGTAAVAASLVGAISSGPEAIIDMATIGMADTFPVASGSGQVSGLGMIPFTIPSIRRTGILTLTMLHPR